jgi:hypothetical protein
VGLHGFEIFGLFGQREIASLVRAGEAAGFFDGLRMVGSV